MYGGEYDNTKGDLSGPPVMNQPMPTTQNVVVVTDSNSPMGRMPPGQWTTGLCGCFEDMGSCLASFCCHPFYKCYLSNKMEEHCCMPLCLANADLLVLRMKLRTLRNIPGGAISDCCAVTWCSCCVAAQLSREWDSSVMCRQ
ncbi:placenta-specific gene 8 protein-like [Ptychodera flava]|uniref:placenta-specific gene 8 protein-like n=1 Tax=Ptychodera flava TaxID=63121 RepID=UPI00396A93F2